MEKQWQKFEKECYIYLQNTYGNNANFTAYGNSNSTVSDILVETHNGRSFFIEIKSPNAQSGQFVLLPNEKHRIFNYSIRNATPFFPETKIIIDYMNDNFNDFFCAGTKGKTIEIDENILFSWIKSYYQEKRVLFFITKGTNYIIIPIEQFEKYFNVRATYRVKKSGSNSLQKSDIYEIEEIIKKNNINGKIVREDKDVYLKTEDSLGGYKLTGNKYTYLFKENIKSKLLIRKLSNTKNSNVIFQINLKNYSQDPIDLNVFLNTIYLNP